MKQPRKNEKSVSIDYTHSTFYSVANFYGGPRFHVGRRKEKAQWQLLVCWNKPSV